MVTTARHPVGSVHRREGSTMFRTIVAAVAACLFLSAAVAWEDEEAAIKAANPYHQAIIEEQCRRPADERPVYCVDYLPEDVQSVEE